MTLPFENDTGPVIKKLASRSIQTDKRRNLFVIVTIALAAALMAAIFCAGAGSDRKLEADIRGQYQAVVVNCDRDTIERLKDCPEVERWGLSQNYGSARYGDSVLTVEYADANWMELGKKPSFTGTLPQAANEILVERAFLDYFEIPAEVGQTIEVNLGNGKQTYTVSGIMDVENDSRMFQLYVSEAFVEEMAQGEPLFEFRLRYTGADSMELEQLKADIAAFLSANDVSEDQIFYSSNYFDMQGFKSGVMKYYIPVAILLLVACAVVILQYLFHFRKGQNAGIWTPESDWHNTKTDPADRAAGGIAVISLRYPAGAFGWRGHRVCHFPGTLELDGQSALSGCDRSSLRPDGISVHSCACPHGGEGIPNRSGPLQWL